MKKLWWFAIILVVLKLIAIDPTLIKQNLTIHTLNIQSRDTFTINGTFLQLSIWMERFIYKSIKIDRLSNYNRSYWKRYLTLWKHCIMSTRLCYTTLCPAPSAVFMFPPCVGSIIHVPSNQFARPVSPSFTFHILYPIKPFFTSSSN